MLQYLYASNEQCTSCNPIIFRDAVRSVPGHKFLMQFPFLSSPYAVYAAFLEQLFGGKCFRFLAVNELTLGMESFKLSRYT